MTHRIGEMLKETAETKERVKSGKELYGVTLKDLGLEKVGVNHILQGLYPSNSLC